MKKLLIGFSSSNKPLAKVIKFLDRTRFSHVYVKWYVDSCSRYIIYQASGIAVNFMGQSLFNDTWETLEEIEIEISDAQFNSCLQFCIDNAGRSYGLRQLLGMLYVGILRLFGISASNPLKDGHKTFVCSELVGVILEKYNNLDLGIDLETAGPQELYECLVNLKKHKQI